MPFSRKVRSVLFISWRRRNPSHSSHVHFRRLLNSLPPPPKKYLVGPYGQFSKTGPFAMRTALSSKRLSRDQLDIFWEVVKGGLGRLQPPPNRSRPPPAVSLACTRAAIALRDPSRGYIENDHLHRQRNQSPPSFSRKTRKSDLFRAGDHFGSQTAATHFGGLKSTILTYFFNFGNFFLDDFFVVCHVVRRPG